MREVIEWKLPEDVKPDDDELVLVMDFEGGTTTALLSEGCWYDYPSANAFGFTDDAKIAAPQFWADMPCGKVEFKEDIRSTADKIRNLWLWATELRTEVAKETIAANVPARGAYTDMQKATDYLLKAQGGMLELQEKGHA